MKIPSLLRILNKCNCSVTYMRSSYRVISLYPITRNESTLHKVNLANLEDIKWKNVTLNKYLNTIEEKYRDLSSSDKHKKEADELLPIVDCMNRRREILKNIKSLKDLERENDEALKDLIESDMKEYLTSLKRLEEELQCEYGFLLHSGWTVEVADYAETELGGIRHGSMLISGKDAFKLMKYEAGVHRVQRVPLTEKGGRIHTSTVSIVVLPQPTDIQIHLDQKDLKIETKRATGAGGQHVNTTDSAVRVTHLPTGVSVECQVDRSQIKNKRIAMTKLRTLLYQRELDSQMAKMDSTKKSQVRTNFRNEKIRTYNFNQDRITDHRIQGNIHNLKGFLEGNEALEELIMKLDVHYHHEQLLEKVKEINSG